MEYVLNCFFYFLFSFENNGKYELNFFYILFLS